MADYKLVYLNYRGRAELIRFIFAHAGVAYEDSRIDSDSWLKLRPETQFGLLPYLEIKSAEITLSGNATVARYLAEKYNLGGSDAVENAGISAIVEVCEDLWVRIHSIYWLKDETTKTEAKKVLKESYLPVVLAKLEAQIAKNNSKDNWIFGQKVTYADFAVYVLMECLIPEMPGSPSDSFPHIAGLMQSVKSLEGIKKWIETRPKTEH